MGDLSEYIGKPRMRVDAAELAVWMSVNIMGSFPATQ
jgi:hypothetical protein